MSKVNASKITPEQKKFLDSATGTSSITTEQDIRAVGNAQLENILRKQNQEVLDTTSGEIAQDDNSDVYIYPTPRDRYSASMHASS